MKALRELFLNHLAEIHDAELRIAETLEKMAATDTHWMLKMAILSYLRKTEGHPENIMLVFGCFAEKTRRKSSKPVSALLEETDRSVERYAETEAIDAALIAEAKKLIHFEMASFSCLHEWAEMLDCSAATGILHEILEDLRAIEDDFNDLRYPEPMPNRPPHRKVARELSIA